MLVAALLVGLCPCANASAALSHQFVTSFTGTETPVGSLGDPTAMAVDQAMGDVYVADSATLTINKFTATGEYICQITGAGSASKSASECDNSAGGSPAGGFTSQLAPGSNSAELLIAVDNSEDANAGDLYVAGTELVEETTGHGVEVTPHTVIDRFSPSGAYMAQLVLTEISGIAVNGYGDLWVQREDGSFEVEGSSEFKELPTLSEYNPAGVRLEQLVTSFGEASGNKFSLFAAGYSAGIYVTNGFGAFESDIEEDLLTAKEGVRATLKTIQRCGFCQSGLAIDQSEDDVYVLDHERQPESPEGRIVEYAPSGSEISSFGASQLHSYTAQYGAMAVNPGDGDIYAVYAEGADPTVYVYGPAPGPRIRLQAPTDVQTKSVVVNALVDPRGVATTYQFEWGTGRGYGHTAPAAPSSAGIGSSYERVSAGIEGLQPGTTYHYRLVARNSTGTASGADAEFSSKPIPTIDSTKAKDLTPSEAHLTAEINPHGNQASYRIEYGEGLAYGHSTPEVGIGAGQEDVVVSQSIADLIGNTTYHWRVVVSYPEGGSTARVYSHDHEFVYLTELGIEGGCPNELRRVGASASLPDCRAYEMVTPQQKNGATFGLGFAILHSLVAGDGNGMIAATIQPTLESSKSSGGTADRQSDGEPYALARTEAGWTISPLAPPVGVAALSRTFAAEADSDTALFSGPATSDGVTRFYVRQSNGELAEVGPLYPPEDGSLATNVTEEEVSGYSREFSDLVYEISSTQEWPFDTTYQRSAAASLYEYVGTHQSEPLLVGVSGGASSRKLVSRCRTVAGDGKVGTGGISSEGRIVFFTALSDEAGGCPSTVVAPAKNELFARIEASRTVSLSERSPTECTTTACKGSSAGDAQFVDASEDGSKVFFLDSQQLTDKATQGSGSAREDGCTSGAGCNLYIYDFSAQEGHNLVDAATGSAGSLGPQVQGVMAVSPDGSHVYFVAKGVLTMTPNNEGRTADGMADNLYLYERDAAYPEGHIAYIATLPASDSQEWAQGPTTANVTPSGRYLVFTSHGDLTADDISASTATQVFQYDAEQETLTRISIGERGLNDDGNEGIGPATIVPPLPYRSDPTMSDDGGYVFFESPVGLTPQAVNMVRLGTKVNGQPSYAQNIYEYHAGQVYLVSDGKDVSTLGEGSESAVKLIGADTTGQNVFFSTMDPLTGGPETGLNYYDARVNGGFIIGQQGESQCDGETCQGPLRSIPALKVPVSATFEGKGDLIPHHTAKTSRRAKRHARQHRPAPKATRCKRTRKRCKKNGSAKKRGLSSHAGVRRRARMHQ